MIDQVVKRLVLFVAVIVLLPNLTFASIYNTTQQSEATHTQENDKQEELKKDFETKLKLAQEGDSEAQNALAIIYAEGVSVEQNDVEAIKWFLKSAEQGNTFAACNLALHYTRGQGVEKDIVQALKWSFISNSLDGLKCNPNDFIDYFKPTRPQKTKASQLALKWLRSHPTFTDNFGEKPWMDKRYKIKSRTYRF